MSPQEITDIRCSGCGNYVDPEDLFCSNCGRSVEAAGQPPEPQIETGFQGFDCAGCGASMTFDAEQQGLRCAFCGSVRLQRQPQTTGRAKPAWFVPFVVSRESAAQQFRRWIGSGFFRPSGISQQASIVATRAIYLPFWVFRAHCHTYYAADSSRTPPFARASWCPVFGERECDIEDVLVPASGSLSPWEVAELAPFDFSRREEYVRERLREYLVEDFGLSRRGARPAARQLMMERERAEAAAMVPGSSRNVRVNPLFTNLRAEPALLPVWINAYQFREKTYRFLVNGQTGKVVGRAPFSWAKLALLIAVVLGILLLILFLASRSRG